MWSLALDAIVAVLLTVTIIYAVRLHRRLGTLRRDRAELERVAGHFEASIRRAEDSLANIKASAEQFHTERVDAKRLQDDLRFLIERAEGLADRLDAGVRAARDTAKRLPVDAGAQTAAAEGRRPVAVAPSQVAPACAPITTSAPDVASAPTSAAAPPPGRALADGLAACAPAQRRRDDGEARRSESERELLAALAAGR